MNIIRLFTELWWAYATCPNFFNYLLFLQVFSPPPPMSCILSTKVGNKIWSFEHFYSCWCNLLRLFYPWKIQFYTKQSILYNNAGENYEPALLLCYVFMSPIILYSEITKEFTQQSKKSGSQGIFYYSSLVGKGYRYSVYIKWNCWLFFFSKRRGSWKRSLVEKKGLLSKVWNSELKIKKKDK